MPGPDTGPIAPKKVEGPVAIWLDEWASMSPSPPAARQPVIDVAAVRKQTAVSEAVLLNERICLGAVHKWYREPPAPLVEVAGGTSVMPGMRHVASGGETAYTARDVAGLLEIGDEGGPTLTQMRCYSDLVTGGNRYRYYPGRCVQRSDPGMADLMVAMMSRFCASTKAKDE